MQASLFDEVNGGRQTDDERRRILPGVWRAFTSDHDKADAARRFEERYGRPPKRIIERAGLLYVGPIGGDEGRQSCQL